MTVKKKILPQFINSNKKKGEGDSASGDSSNFLDGFKVETSNPNDINNNERLTIKADAEGSNQDSIKTLSGKKGKKDENLVSYSSIFHHDYIANQNQEKNETEEVSTSETVTQTQDGNLVVNKIKGKAKNQRGF
jgi:hypothetical protein